MTTTNFDSIWSFCAVAQEGSFTQAAKALRLDKSKVSRDIRALEGRLGTTLLLRTTRNVRLTPEGRSLYERASPAFAAIQDALTFAAEKQNTPLGEVHFTTTPELGRVLLAPVLAAFRARYPRISLVLTLDAALLDPEKGGADLALRVGRAGAEQLTARKVGELRSGFYASPEYLARRGHPAQLEHLKQHDGLWPVPAPGHKAFTPTGHKVTPPVVTCMDFEMLRQLALSAAGVALLPEFLVSRDETRGALVRVLPNVSVGAGPVFIVSRPVRQLPRRVALLREHLLRTVPRLLSMP